MRKGLRDRGKDLWQFSGVDAVILLTKGINTNTIINHVTSINQINTVKREVRSVARTQLHTYLCKECSQGSANHTLELWKLKNFDLWIQTSISALCICCRISGHPCSWISKDECWVYRQSSWHKMPDQEHLIDFRKDDNSGITWSTKRKTLSMVSREFRCLARPLEPPANSEL